MSWPMRSKISRRCCAACRTTASWSTPRLPRRSHAERPEFPLMIFYRRLAPNASVKGNNMQDELHRVPPQFERRQGDIGFARPQGQGRYAGACSIDSTRMMSSCTLRRSASSVVAAKPRLIGDARRAVEHHHAVADFHRLVDLMGDEHRGLVVLAHQPHELGAQIARGHFIERGERLVAQQDLRDRPRKRARSRRAGACRPTAHADSRSRGRTRPSRVSQARAVSSACLGSRSRICRPSRTLSSAERHGISRSFWNTMPILPRKNSNSRNGSWPITSRVAGTRLDQSGDDVEHGRLAAAGLAQHGDDLALGDLERQFVHGDEIAAPVRTPERLAHVVKRMTGSIAMRLTSPARTPRDSAAPNFRSR